MGRNARGEERNDASGEKNRGMEKIFGIPMSGIMVFLLIVLVICLSGPSGK